VRPRGRFITLEGGEGAGKSTQARRLADTLRAGNRQVVVTREPGGAPGAEHLRSLLLSGEIAWSPLAEVMLHFAARAEHIERTIAPALEAGAWVVCDRFYDSTMVYQGWGQGADRAAIAALIALMPVHPDLTIVLDVPVATTLARLASRGAAADRYERLGAPFFQRIRDGFHAVAAADPGRCVMIDGQGAEQDVAAAILATVHARLTVPAVAAP
jgi:dTMP kinase